MLEYRCAKRLHVSTVGINAAVRTFSPSPVRPISLFFHSPFHTFLSLTFLQMTVGVSVPEIKDKHHLSHPSTKSDCDNKPNLSLSTFPIFTGESAPFLFRPRRNILFILSAGRRFISPIATIRCRYRPVLYRFNVSFGCSSISLPASISSVIPSRHTANTAFETI